MDGGGAGGEGVSLAAGGNAGHSYRQGYANLTDVSREGVRDPRGPVGYVATM